MSDRDAQQDAELLFEELRDSAPLELTVEMSLDGDPRSGIGYVNASASAIKIARPDGSNPDLLVFPTYLIAHWWARYFELGPRPTVVEDGALGIVRDDLDDTKRRAEKLSELPDEVRDALDREGALRWSVSIRDSATSGEVFGKSLEVYDAHTGGIWKVTPVPDEDGETGLVVVAPSCSSEIWLKLTDLLPSEQEWENVSSGLKKA